jgi:hypothetical protein
MSAVLSKFKFLRKKPVAIALVAALIVGGGGAAAFAYWTFTGAGTGTGTVGTPTTPLVVNQTSTITNLAPGSAAQSLSGNFNNSNSGPIYVTSIATATLTVTKATGAVTGTCDATDFTVTGFPLAVGAQVPAGTAQGAWTGATIAFNNKATNQDQCKGATISIAYTSN